MMNNSYLNEIMESQCVCIMNDQRTIITDRMGSWEQQDVVLTWEGNCNKEIISITPDEVEILFENGLTRNVARGEDGKLYEKTTYADVRTFAGAIVCGILAPTTKANIRQEIIDYAKKMGYISDTMKPVKMFSGSKSLIYNPNGTYNIFFAWNDNILNKINRKLLDNFTKDFFKGKNIEIKDNGVLMKELPENTVFSRKNIDIFREYDIKLKYLSPEYDKKLLLKAVMKRAFVYLPANFLRRGQFDTTGNIIIPEDRQEQITFNEYGKKNMNCGTIYYNNEYDSEMYTYRITVPYNEFIRELMVDTEKVLRAKYGKNVFVRFSGFNENICISCNGKPIGNDVERELIALDYAMTFLRDENQYNHYQLYASIISLLESDSTGKFRDEYFSYLKTLKNELTSECKFMF